jgi:hypothetical protein
LYRGISLYDDLKNEGRIRPKGSSPIADVCFGQPGAQFGEGYSFGESIGNAVRAHQVDSDMKGTCYISTSKRKDVATKFATSSNTEDGYVYTLDRDKFAHFGVTEHELAGSGNSYEFEITIKSNDSGDIPEGIIVCKELVQAL